MLWKSILVLILSFLVLARGENYTINYDSQNLLVKEEVPREIGISVKSFVVNATCSNSSDGYLSIFLNSPYSNAVQRFNLTGDTVYEAVNLTYSYQIKIESYCSGNLSINIVFYYPSPDFNTLFILFGVLGLGFISMIIVVVVKTKYEVEDTGKEMELQV